MAGFFNLLSNLVNAIRRGRANTGTEIGLCKYQQDNKLDHWFSLLGLILGKGELSFRLAPVGVLQGRNREWEVRRWEGEEAGSSSVTEIHIYEQLICRLKDSCVPLYNILLALLYIKEALKWISSKAKLQIWQMGVSHRCCCLWRCEASHRGGHPVWIQTLFFLFWDEEGKNTQYMWKGKSWISFDICYQMPAMKKQVLVNTSYAVGCGTPHSSHCAQRRKSLITDSLLLGLPPSSYLNCYKIYEGEERQPPFISVVC